MQTKADDDERLRKHLAEETIQVGLKAEAAAAIRETERLQREEATKLAERQRFEEALEQQRKEKMAQEQDEQRRNKDVTERHQKQLLLNSEAEKNLQAKVSELESAAVELGRKVEDGEKHLQQLKDREEARAREKEQEI